MKKLFLLYTGVFLSGCAGAKLLNATINPLGGTVQYKNGYFVRESSRELALEEMAKFCKGPFEILSEKFNPDVFSLNIGGEHFTSAKDNYMYINFKCEKK